jgi:hypothetical protein
MQTRPLAFIKQSIQKEQRQKFVASILMLFVGGVLMYYTFNSSYFLSAIGLLLVVLGLRYTFIFLPGRKSKDLHLIHLILHQPEQIVWVYGIITERLPFGFQFGNNAALHFRLINKEEYVVELPTNKMKEITAALNPMLPNTTFGYSKDNEQLYMANPALLLKN